MGDIIDFLIEIGNDRALAGKFIEKISRPDCTHTNLRDFLNKENYSDVNTDDITRLLKNRNSVKQDFGITSNLDY